MNIVIGIVVGFLVILLIHLIVALTILVLSVTMNEFLGEDIITTRIRPYLRKKFGLED